MTSIIMLIAGIALIIGVIAAFFYSISSTPDNLQGFYGVFYTILSLLGIAGGVALIIFSFLS